MRISEGEKAKLKKAAEAEGIPVAEFLRNGTRLAALTPPEMWKAIEFMSERSGVPMWDIVFIAIADVYVNFSNEEVLFLKPKAIDRLRKLYWLYQRDRDGFLTKLSRERKKEFEATRASERNL
jgi:hypothetical protein